jgi:transcription elongation factor
MKERVMPVPSRRLAVAGVIAAAVIALPAAAFASGSTSSGKPAPSAAASKSAPAVKSPAPAGKAAAPDPSAAAMKAAARQSGTLERQAEQAMVAALVGQLGVSDSAAQRAMNQINALSDRNGVDPASPAFAAIAHELGVTPARLAAALDAAKQAAGRSVGGH